MTRGTKTPAGARAIVETLSLDAGSLGDGDLSALTLQHTGDQFTSSELESFATLQAELECYNSAVGVELDGGGDGLADNAVEVTISSSHGPESPECILPDIEETHEMEVGDMGLAHTEDINLQLTPQTQHLNANLNLGAPSIVKGTSGSSIVVIQSPLTSSGGNPSHVTVSGGQIVGKIAGLAGNVAQFQPISQTLVTAKSADGNIVQLQPANVSSSGGISTSTIQNMRPLQASVKRPASNTSGPVFAKVIITGNQHGSGQGSSGQPVVIATSQAGGTLAGGQPIKIVTSGSANSGQGTLVASPTKAITLAQAQQMGLLSPTKLQQILPSSPNKQVRLLATQKQSIIVNKLVTSPVKAPAKIAAIVPSSGAGPTIVKSPTKILPAPVSGITQLKAVGAPPSTTTSVSQVVSTSIGTTPATVTASKQMIGPQKVIIRQANLGGSLKPGTVLGQAGSGQVIRIPATQNVMTAGNIAQIQLPGIVLYANAWCIEGQIALIFQLQYVRLVSASSTSGTSTSTSTVKPRTTLVSTTSSRQGQQPATVKMVPIAPAQPSGRPMMPKSGTSVGTQRILIPASGSISQLRAGTVTALPASAVGQLQAGQALLPSGASSFVMVPAHYVQQQPPQATQASQPSQQQVQQAATQAVSVATIAASSTVTSVTTTSTSPTVAVAAAASAASAQAATSLELVSTTQRIQPPTRTTLEPNGIRPRKPCNCTKSQCLKLYCDCFANGEFCNLCNCNNCYNNLEHEEDRQRAIRSCLERNPNAFRPKIGKGMVGDERRHNKGCNCKRSGCLKNYCECYEAKIPCSNNCKCVGCRNVEETCDKKSLRDLADAAEVRVQQQAAVKNKVSAQIQDVAFRPQPPAPPGVRQPSSLMTNEVLEATCECLVAQAEDAERQGLPEEEAERLVLEEFGRCLVQIIQCASKREQRFENFSSPHKKTSVTFEGFLIYMLKYAKWKVMKIILTFDESCFDCSILDGFELGIICFMNLIDIGSYENHLR
ncbi:Protein lin-54 homolog [Gryllus bimaculatus]|nr:Protein lin-54 homolog [Gryllus bimaculatus]